MRRLIVGILMAAGAFAWPNGFTKHYALTVASGQVSGTLNNFPALYSGTVAAFATAANGGYVQHTCTQTVGTNSLTVPCDLILTSDAAGTALLTGWEWESYTASTGASVIWFRVGSIANGTVVHVWVGNSSVTTLQAVPANTWNSNYRGVWHLGNGTSLNYNDSTSNGLTGSSSNAPTVATGPFGGGGATFSNANVVDLGSVGGVSAYSLWVYPTSTYGHNTILWQGQTSGSRGIGQEVGNCYNPSSNAPFGAEAEGGNNACAGGAANLTPLNAWTYLIMTVSGSMATLYANMTPYSGTGTGTTYGTSGDLFLGYFTPLGYPAVNGIYAEIRAMTAAPSNAWIAAEYNNQTAPQAFWILAGPYSQASGQALIM